MLLGPRSIAVSHRVVLCIGQFPGGSVGPVRVVREPIFEADLQPEQYRGVVDGAMLHLIEMWLEAPVEETDERGNKHRSTARPLCDISYASLNVNPIQKNEC